MRLSLLGFNAVALGTLIVPAVLIFDATSSSLGAWSEVWLTAFGLGALCLFGALARLSGKKTNASAAIPLMVLGLGLIAAPVTVVLGIALRH